jgi:hypothetical protein
MYDKVFDGMSMSERIQELAVQVYGSAATAQEIKFAELIIQECIACCGSQADMKNIRKRFGLPTESNIKYPSPDAIGHYSQYGREYNIPK